MQTLLDLGFGASLTDIRARLRAAMGDFGDGRRLDPLSQLIKAMISGRTRDDVSWPAYLRLRRAFPAWSRLAETPAGEIEALICDVTHAGDKAAHLAEMVAAVLDRAGSLRLDFLAEWPVETAIAWLAKLPGVGRFAACSTLNFSELRRPAMVVDAHVARVAVRLGLADPKASPAEISERIMALAPATWGAADFYELHWLMKTLGQNACQVDTTRCGACGLRSQCPSAKPHLRLAPV